MINFRFSQVLQHDWHLLTDPSPAIDGAEMRQYATALSTMMLILTPTLMLFFAARINWLYNSHHDGEILIQIRWMFVAGLLFISTYLISRTRYVKSTILLAITSGSLITIYGAFAHTPVDINNFSYLTLPLFFSGLLLPRKMAVGYIAANGIFILLLMKVNPSLRSAEFIGGPLTFLTFTVILVFMIATYRGKLEQARKAQLAQIVEERTASLLKSNEALQMEIRKRYQAEANLLDEMAFFGALFDKTNDAIFIMDLNGIHLRANKRATEMLGYTNQEFVGMHFTELIAPDEYSDGNRIYNKLVNGDTMPVYQRTFLHKDQTRIPVELNVALVRDSEGHPRYLQSAVRDITNRKKVEEWLQQALENEKRLTDIRTRFFSMVSHEFRTPLTVIKSSNGILTQYRDRLDDQRRVQHHDRIDAEVTNLVTLLDEVMMINQGDANHIKVAPEPLDLVEFCHETVEELKPTLSSNQNLEVVTPSEPLHVVLDPYLLRRILTNLLSNAIKYSPEGGKIKFGLDIHDCRLKFTVSDQGIGIPVEDQNHLFEIFHRARNVGKINGTGLGLVIVRQAVEVQGGQINFRSIPGRGTTFTVDLPCELAAVVSS